MKLFFLVVLLFEFEEVKLQCFVVKTLKNRLKLQELVCNFCQQVCAKLMLFLCSN